MENYILAWPRIVYYNINNRSVKGPPGTNLWEKEFALSIVEERLESLYRLGSDETEKLETLKDLEELKKEALECPDNGYLNW